MLLKSAEVTRLALVVESIVHAFDHYGQMVEYLDKSRAVKRGYRCTAYSLPFRSAKQRRRRQKDCVGDYCPSLHSVGAFPTRRPELPRVG